ncbi:MAG TPA: aldo/keto reductase [Spirillospora sp.]|nr:aldo/keto reductase [Spirillospora sp.]
MKYGQIEGVNKPVSRIVQGTTIISSSDLDGSFKLLDDVFELGVNTFDTAQSYGRGDNERTVGRWINERGVRDQVVIISKGAHLSQDRNRVTPFDIEADIHDSLARFKTDFLDIYLLHRDDPTVPVGPIVEKLNEYHEKGVIGIYGGSNWTVERIKEANAYAEAHGLKPFLASSPNFSLADQIKEPWKDCISISGPGKAAERAWYQANQMPLFTWSSMAGGFFSGRFRRDNLDTFTDYNDRVVVEAYCYEPNFQRLDRAEQLAAEKGVTVAQIAVAYIFNQPLNIYALIASRSAEELRQNITALDLKLTEAEMDWLDLRSDTR